MKPLVRFLQNGDNHLFKGRLKLHKRNDWKTIAVKGAEVGEISTESFINCLLKTEVKLNTIQP